MCTRASFSCSKWRSEKATLTAITLELYRFEEVQIK